MEGPYSNNVFLLGPGSLLKFESTISLVAPQVSRRHLSYDGENPSASSLADGGVGF